jgi:hypothetical protein
MSGYKDIDVFSLISKIWSILGMICHTWGGWTHQPRSSPTDGSSLLVLDQLGRSCVTVLTPFPARVQQLLSVAAVARPWCGLPADHGGHRDGRLGDCPLRGIGHFSERCGWRPLGPAQRQLSRSFTSTFFFFVFATVRQCHARLVTTNYTLRS